jgi:hypothetical protein
MQQRIACGDPLCIGLTQSLPSRYRVMGLFCCFALASELATLCNKKASRLASGGFVTSSGFKPETF